MRKDPKKKTAELRTDWKRVRSLTDEQIRAGIAKDPEIRPTDREFWRHAKVVMPGTKS